MWVDTYASEFSRDIEPSVEGGDYVLRVTADCVALYKSNATCATAPAGNLCCSRGEKEVWNNVWSLVKADGSDYMLTNNATERAGLVKGGGWKELCSAIPNPTAFCVNTSIADGRDGPFMLYNTASALPAPSGNHKVHTVPVYRCLTSGGQHFISGDAGCEGKGTSDQLIGYASNTPGSETLRALYRCTTGTPADGIRFHALDVACDHRDATPVLGYVR